MNPTALPAWQALQEHYAELKDKHLRELLADFHRSEWHVSGAGWYLNYAKHRATNRTLELLFQLAREAGLEEKRAAMFRGEKINATENRAVLHTALRKPTTDTLVLDGENVVTEVRSVLKQMALFAESVRGGEWRGHTGKPIAAVVNIGIGGSDLGPAMAYEALKSYSAALKMRFVSNVDGSDLADKLSDLDPETTLFIVSSKTFTTLETMTNARTARDWLLQALPSEATERHFVAVSTNEQAVKEFGIGQVFHFWDWVGGRYSLPSAIGLSLMIAIGAEQFEEFLAGMHEMDEHFLHAPLEQNLPILMALLGVWYNNFFGAQTLAVLPYAYSLRSFPDYLQQLDMESNGKSTTLGGDRVMNYQTGAIVWGQAGTNGQHAFYQLIHQGTKLIPCDFIGFCRPDSVRFHSELAEKSLRIHHDLLTANLFAQSESLALGTAAADLDKYAPAEREHHHFTGNTPSSTLLATELSPRTLGSLIALYEHKVFVQGTIWGINSFDQWGVELGKKMTTTIATELQDTPKPKQHDPSTNALIHFYLETR